MDDIPIVTDVTDESPPSSGEIEIDDERPTSPGGSKQDSKSVEAKGPDAEARPADAKLGDTKLGDAKPGDARPADAKPGDTKLADPAKAFDARPPDAKSEAKPASTGPIPPTPPRVEVAPLLAPLPSTVTPASPPVAAAAPPSPPVAPTAATPINPGSAGGAAPLVTVKDLPPMRALAPTEPEGLEVHFEDEDPISSPRNSEPEAEIALEDLVSVESAPSPTKQLAVKPLPPSETPTPARGFFPVGAVTPPPVTNGPVSGSPGRISATPVSSPSSAAAKPASGPKVARVIVPTASPLAPPPMSEVAATGRRKARPWWEELFNDDFIRTMAKVTDEQIAKEVESSSRRASRSRKGRCSSTSAAAPVVHGQIELTSGVATK